jgi:hypothetical protein
MPLTDTGEILCVLYRIFDEKNVIQTNEQITLQINTKILLT